MEQREIEEREVNEEEWKMKKLEESRLEKEDKEGSIEEENEIKEKNGNDSKDTKNKDEGNEEEECIEENGEKDRVKIVDEVKDKEECIEEENGEEGKEKMKEENELNNKQQIEHNNEEDDKEGNIHETESQNEDSRQNYESESVSQYILDTSPISDHPVTSLEINMKDLPPVTHEEHPMEEKGILTSQQIQLSDNKDFPVVQKVHSHHSTIQDIIYNTGNGLETPVYSSRGEVPGSVIQDLLYPDRLEIHQVKETSTTRGKPPPTTIQKLIHGVCVCVRLCICLSVV